MAKVRSGSYDSSMNANIVPVLGIHTLHTPGGAKEIAIDRGEICWPRDLLPQALPVVARVLTFGYDAGRFGVNTNLDIEDAALQLINELERVRSTSEERKRPFVAIAHSLGGIVLKKALIMSNNKISLRHILGSLAGIIFLATPHRGSALADVADKILRLNLVIGAPQKFIKSLRQNSQELASIADNFRQIADQRSLPITSFYELLPTRGRLICFSDIVVYKESALLSIQSENALGVALNHHEICKYRDANDSVFRDLVSRVRTFIERGPIQSRARVFLPWDTTQHFTGRRDCLQQIHESFCGTGRRIVALYGDGGMGKTEVSLKYARENEHHYDYVFFVDSASVQSLEADFINLHDKVGLSSEKGREFEEMKQFLLRERHWLLVLDNDDDWVALDQLRFPETSNGHILITCRGREHTSGPRISRAVRMRALEWRDAKDLLFSRAGIDLKERAQWDLTAKSIVKFMGCQPLAVDSAAAYILCSETNIDEYLGILRNKQLPQRILSYRPKASRYQISVESILNITLNEIKNNPCAYKLLTLLVWLDRSKTTVSFLKRAVSPQPYWGSDGMPSTRDPRDSYVPEDIIELIDGPDFDIALKELKLYALVASDEKFEEESTATKDLIVLHPITYSYVREAMTADQMVQSALCALSLVVHAHPVMQAGLDQSKYSSQEIIPQIFQCHINCKQLEERNLEYTQAIRNTQRNGKPSFAERTAEMLFETIRGYGEGHDKMDDMLLDWLKNLLEGSMSIGLQARLWCTRLPLEFYSCGKLIEGCEAADNFVQSVESRVQSQELTKRENAHLGFLRHLSVEYRVREPGLSNEEVWRRRAAYIEAWQPLDRDDPSELEKYAMGTGVRMRGKLAKDFGLFKEAYYFLKLFIEQHATRGSREEGWAISDFGQAVLEIEDAEDGSEILLDLITKGTNFGERLSHPSGATLCEIVSFLCSRAIENRMFERGHLTQQDRENVRESDTMFLEINHAVNLLRQGRNHPERYENAKRELLGLKKRFEQTRANGALWYDDQTREFSVILYLAQIAHLRHEWDEAQSRWKEAIDYGRTVMKKWEEDHFYIDVATYSLADVQLSAGGEPNLIIPKVQETIRRVDGERVTWMLGVGTFWLDHVKRSMEPKLRAEEMRLDREKEQM
ncbi:hypothetical protein N7486_004270 [Penicillium sp. IBT 16267x]|nr:hypothetical protein N7486_004270 [Penicillium sp. IBT 16267x]